MVFKVLLETFRGHRKYRNFRRTVYLKEVKLTIKILLSNRTDRGIRNDPPLLIVVYHPADVGDGDGDGVAIVSYCGERGLGHKIAITFIKGKKLLRIPFKD